MNSNPSCRRACVIWITGFSGAGKSSLAKRVTSRLDQIGLRPVLLDGDELRTAMVGLIPPDHAYERVTRLELARTYSRLCQLFTQQGHTVVVATVSLFHEIHFWNRAHLPRYIEIFLDTSIDDIHRRNFTYPENSAKESASQVVGIDFEAELPQSPDLRFTNHSLDQLDLITSTICKHVYLKSQTALDANA